ncbi:hypothetical protein K435DRAFT_969827 [Dendrothele bispora CBS 962.96]|uniref:Uncharacterized protein n=1 Tax=Dendrothele bispora (strain CBS 962.96) TaxID=1314807 RepID=A0A4S8LGF7_DENBC|nr:hypothetical protein K435DRAFT_969827 [Dendrothele bispora CBS 962.96]
MTVFELLVSTAYVVAILAVDALLFHDNLSQEWTQHFLRLSQQVYAGTDVFLRLNFLLSDGIVVWRTWVLFPFDKLVKSTLVFCMLVTAGLSFRSSSYYNIYRACMPSRRRSSNSESTHVSSTIDHKRSRDRFDWVQSMVNASLFLGSSFPNPSRFRSHRKAIKQNLMSTGNNTSKALKTLWLLIESGLVYCIVWMAYIIVIETGPNPNDAYATSAALIFASIIPLLAALFPSLVILVAALEDTKRPSNYLSPDGNNISGSLSQSIRFASENAAASAANVSMTRSGGILEVDLQDRGITLARSLSADVVGHPIKNNV